MTPEHYTKELPCEAIHIIDHVVNRFQESPNVAFCIGNALKYLLRVGNKESSREDMKKALNYLHRAIYGEWFVEKES